MEVIFESTAFPCNRNCKFRLFLCAHGRRLDKFSYVYKNCAYKFDLRDSINKTFQKRRSYNLHFPHNLRNGGPERTRTACLLIANEALYQMSYGPRLFNLALLRHNFNSSNILVSYP